MRSLLFLLLMTATAFAQTNIIYIDQIGVGNTVSVEQKDAGGKNVNIINEGDANYISILQQGTGTHSTSITSTSAANTNNANSFVVSQSGSANHTANIVLNNSSSGSNNNTASITQTGNAPKSFTLNLTGSGIGFTGLQDNLNTPDSATLSITCLTPPCTGYSYTKN